MPSIIGSIGPMPIPHLNEVVISLSGSIVIVSGFVYLSFGSTSPAQPPHHLPSSVTSTVSITVALGSYEDRLGSLTTSPHSG